MLVVALLTGVGSHNALAADLHDDTADAFAAYLERATRDFLDRVDDPVAAPTRDGVLSAGPARGDGILNVPGGLVHNWVATAFVRQVSLARVLEVSRRYSSYSAVYKSIIASSLLGQRGDTYEVLTRLQEGEAGVHAVLDVRSTIRYSYPAPGVAYAISNADEIREVKEAGQPTERRLPAGHDSGYLWRAATFTRFVALDGGVYIEMETLGLSRRFPFLLGWIIEPIARRLGRKSVETSLQEFARAIAVESASPSGDQAAARR